MECNHGSTHTLSTERTPVPAPQNTAAREVYDKERAHVLAPWSAWGARDPMVITAAEGCYLTDGDGNRLLDFTSQLVNTNIGHQHPVVVKAIQDQAAELEVYEEKVHELADQMIEIDLDDGMKVNYTKFQSVLAKVK